MKISTVIKVAGALLIGVGLLQLWGAIFPLFLRFLHQTVLSNPLNFWWYFPRALPSLALSAWAFATAFGLLRHRAWARPSVIVLGLVGVFGFLGGVAGALFASMPIYPGLPRWFSLGIYGSFLGAGGISAVLVAEFTATRMDEAFHSSLAPRLGFFDAASGSDPTPAPVWSAIPLSVSVIAMWLILLWPLGFYEDYFRTQGLTISLVPANLFGGVLDGRLRIPYLLVMAAVGLVTGIGLLRAKEWARITALVLCAYSIAGVFLFAIRPNAFKAMSESMGSLNISISPAYFWLSKIWDTLPAVGASYLLIKRKGFFKQSSPH